MKPTDTWTWYMEIDGDSSDTALKEYVTGVSVTTTRDRMSSMAITLRSPLVKDNGKTKDIFAKGRELKVFAGFGKPLFLNAGIIDSHELSLDNQQLVVKCLDKGGLMGVKEKNEVYTGKKDSDIVKTIAGQYGLKADVEDTDATVDRTQSNRTDYAFLRDLAARNGCEFFVDYDQAKKLWVLHFRTPKGTKQSKVFTYDYSHNTESLVTSFSPAVSGKVERKSKLIIHAWLSEPRQDVTLEEKVLGEGTVEELFDLRFQTKQEAETFIKGQVKKRDDSYMEASCTVLGNPELHVSEIHTFTGLTSMFFRSLDGDYRIRSVTHELGANFTTSLELLKVS